MIQWEYFSDEEQNSVPSFLKEKLISWKNIVKFPTQGEFAEKVGGIREDLLVSMKAGVKNV